MPELQRRKGARMAARVPDPLHQGGGGAAQQGGASAGPPEWTGQTNRPLILVKSCS